jgi:hypothetical protein
MAKAKDPTLPYHRPEWPRGWEVVAVDGDGVALRGTRNGKRVRLLSGIYRKRYETRSGETAIAEAIRHTDDLVKAAAAAKEEKARADADQTHLRDVARQLRAEPGPVAAALLILLRRPYVAR